MFVLAGIIAIYHSDQDVFERVAWNHLPETMLNQANAVGVLEALAEIWRTPGWVGENGYNLCANCGVQDLSSATDDVSWYVC